VVQLVEHAAPKLVGWCGTEDLKTGTCGLFSHVLGVNGWLQGNGTRAVLLFTRHQCSIHWENRRVAHGASERRWVSQTTRDTPETSTKSEYNETLTSKLRCFISRSADEEILGYDIVGQLLLKDLPLCRIWLRYC